MVEPVLAEFRLVHAQVAQEYELKSAYIFNFLNFIDFPESHKREIVLCLPDDLLREHFDPMSNQDVAQARLIIVYLDESSFKGKCDVLFIPSYARERTKEILKVRSNRAILTIGESDGFATNWGIIEFYIQQKSLRFRINLARANSMGLKLRASLLKRAEVLGLESIKDAP
jgi:hypothetical protein